MIADIPAPKVLAGTSSEAIEEGEPAMVGAESAAAPENGTNVWSDELAEAAFLGDAKARGEPVVPIAPASSEAPESTDAKPLPPLDELVKRIPAEVRDTLDDL